MTTAAAAAATSTGNVKRIVAAFEFARLRRKLERRRQRLEEWFTTTSVVPATPSATPSASLNSPASSTTSPPTTSTTPTSIDATTTAEPLQVLPARCSTPSIHQDTKCSEEWSFTTSPTTFINRKNYSSGRYTTTSTPATSSIILSGLDTDGLEAQNEFEELATRLGFKSWKVFSCGYVDVPMRQPWPPPVLLEMQNHGVQFRPMPWPSFSGYTVSGVQQTKAQPSVFDCSRSYYYDCLVVCQIGVCKVPCQLFRENVGTYCCLWASYVTTGLTQAFTSHTVVVFCSVNEYMVKLYISKEYLQHCIELYGMTMQVNGIKWQGIRQLQLSVGTYGYLQKMDDHFCIFSDRARVAALQSCFVKCCCRQWGTPWLSFTSCCNCVVNPLNGEKFVQVAEVRGTEIKPFVKESLSKCLQHGLHNPLKASERYLMYGDISVKAAHISEVIAKLIQRVSPNNYQQALLEVQVSQRLLKVDSRGSVVMEQMFRLLHKCGLPAEDLDFINSDGWTSCEPIVDYGGESQNCRQGSMSVIYLHPSSPAHGVEFLPLSKWPKPPWAQLTGIIVVRLNFQSLGVVLRCFNNQFTANGKSYNRFQPRQPQLYWCLYTNTWWNISLTESHSAHSVKWNISVPISVTTLKWSITWVFTDHEVIQSQPKILCKVQLLQISGNSLQMFSGGKIDLTAAKISGQADVLQYWQLLVELQSDWHFIASSMFYFKSKYAVVSLSTVADVQWLQLQSTRVQKNSVSLRTTAQLLFQCYTSTVIWIIPATIVGTSFTMQYPFSHSAELVSATPNKYTMQLKRSGPLEFNIYLVDSGVQINISPGVKKDIHITFCFPILLPWSTAEVIQIILHVQNIHRHAAMCKSNSEREKIQSKIHLPATAIHTSVIALDVLSKALIVVSLRAICLCLVLNTMPEALLLLNIIWQYQKNLQWLNYDAFLNWTNSNGLAAKLAYLFLSSIGKLQVWIRVTPM